jgi:hypothetical protein
LAVVGSLSFVAVGQFVVVGTPWVEVGIEVAVGTEMVPVQSLQDQFDEWL